MYSYDLQATWVVDVQMAYFCDILSMGVCTTRHWKTSGRLVQELNACTVDSSGQDVLIAITSLPKALRWESGSIDYKASEEVASEWG